VGFMRFLLFVFLGFIVWKVIQIFSRSSGNRRQRGPDPFAGGFPSSQTGGYKDIKDADFEELPPDEKK
jgi:hypothetical protein